MKTVQFLYPCLVHYISKTKIVYDYNCVVWIDLSISTGFIFTDLLGLSTFAGSDESQRCIVRKEFTFMSIAERIRFIQTYKTITTKEPYKSRYKSLIFDHPKLASHIHSKEQFFPWHRLMLRNIEKLLQEVSIYLGVGRGIYLSRYQSINLGVGEVSICR